MLTASAERVSVAKEIDTDDGRYVITPFIGTYNGVDGVDADDPEGFLVGFYPHGDGMIRPHFHKIAQFQVVVGGNARLGKHAVPPVSFHYVDVSTPYGPIAPVGDEGVEFFTLRPARRAGIFFMPGAKTEMTQRAGRNLTVTLESSSPPLDGGSGELRTLLGDHGDGLAAFRMILRPNESRTGPDSGEGGGQYYVVIGGGVSCGEEWLPEKSLIFVAHGGKAATLMAGENGAEVLVLQFPVSGLAT